MLSRLLVVILLISILSSGVLAEELCGGVRVEISKNEVSVLAYDCPVSLDNSKDLILEADKNGDGIISMQEVEEFQKEFIIRFGNQETTGIVYIDGKDIPLTLTRVNFQNLYKAKVGEDRQLSVITSFSGSYNIGSGTHTIKVPIRSENTFIDFMIPGVVIKETNGQKGTFNNFPEVKTSQKRGYLLAVFEVPAQKTISVKNGKESVGGFEAVLGLVSIGSALIVVGKTR